MERSSDAHHWDTIYGKYRRDQLGWHAPVLQTSLNWILKYAESKNSPIVDIGGGSSSLVDHLLGHFYSKVTVLDLSQRALDDSANRLGAKASDVTFVCADIRDANLFLKPTQIWHDRAAFHFLFGSEVDSYRDRLKKTLATGGTFILGVFSENAPPTCSSLAVNRHSVTGLERIFSPAFRLLESKIEIHYTPTAIQQEYLYTAWERLP